MVLNQVLGGVSMSCVKQIDRTLRQATVAYLMLVFIATTFSAYRNYLNRDNWKIGDWLINYSGGFVRRGLTGEVVLFLSEYITLSPGYFVLLIHVACYGVFFSFSYLLLRQQRSLLPYALLIFSPFLFTFQLNDFDGGYRKEILYFALLASLTWSKLNLASRQHECLTLLALALYPLLILSHEMLAIFLPFVLIILLHRHRPDVKTNALAIVICIVSLLTFCLTILYPGTLAQELQIIASLKERGFPMSGGAIDFLHAPPIRRLDKGILFHFGGYYLLTYLAVFLLSLIAYLPLRKPLSIFFTQPKSLGLLGISMLGCLLVCSVATDWGRVVYSMLVSLFFLALLTTTPHRAQSEPPALTNDPQTPGAPEEPTLRGYILLLAALIWTLCWHIPHTGPGGFIATSFAETNLYKLLEPFLWAIWQW